MERWQSETAPPWFAFGQAGWNRMSDVERWRFCRRSTICNGLGLARTSYLNARPVEAKKRAQRGLAAIRATRPPLPHPKENDRG
jgi:hypothetical protein